jgi:DNA-binding NtrC family response regulator
VRGVTADALAALVAHEWRGNVRELSNALERAVIFAGGEQVALGDLPDAVQAALPEPATATATAPEPSALETEPAAIADEAATVAAVVPTSGDLHAATAAFERAFILRVIDECGGNKRRAAKVLGLGVTSLYRKLGPIGDDIEA